MKITIHRGANEIGGTCIRLSSESTCILLDLGQPLSGISATPSMPDTSIDGVLISHPHQDHFGLIDLLPPTVPIYIGRLAKSLIDATRYFLGKELHTNSFRHFEKWTPFSIGEFVITPYLVDHSAVDAYAFLIEAEGKRVFYSGDFRAHGNKGRLFENMIDRPPGKIDMLFMEGTMLARTNDRFPNEKSVEHRIRETIAQQENISFVITSAQTIDHLVSVYNACRRTDKIMVIDFYTAWVLDLAKQVSPGLKAMEWKHLALYARKGHYDAMRKHPEVFSKFSRAMLRHRVMPATIKADPSRYVMCMRMSSAAVIKRYKNGKPINVIYSQWEGYLDGTDAANHGAETIAAFRRGEDPEVRYVYAHTSGHATLADLKEFSDALKPDRLIPVHTEHRGLFKDHFANVVELKDGQTYQI